MGGGFSNDQESILYCAQGVDPIVVYSRNRRPLGFCAGSQNQFVIAFLVFPARVFFQYGHSLFFPANGLRLMAHPGLDPVTVPQGRRGLELSLIHIYMVKLADTGDLKSPVFGLAGSSPAIPTTKEPGY